MSMTTPATTDDVERRFRPLTAAEVITTNAWLEDAWAIVRNRRPAISDDITAGTVEKANVVRVLCAMVIRVLRNPDGLSQESVDDYSYKRDGAVAGGMLHLTADELADITIGRRTERSVKLIAYGGPDAY